jgi:S1-C subfamily serine protease
MKKVLVVVLVLSVAGLLLGLQDKTDDIAKMHTKIYKKIAPAIVGVSYGTQSQGSGFIVDNKGLVVTSISSMGPEVSYAYVHFQNHKRCKGKVIKRVRDDELALIKIDEKDLTALELGDSDEVKVGQSAYVFGDSFESILKDGQVAMSFGTISDIYDIRERPQQNAFYKGKVFETTAAVNPNQAGAPLIDAKGKVIGMVTMNFSDAKMLGVAIPINKLKKAIEKEREKLK